MTNIRPFTLWSTEIKSAFLFTILWNLWIITEFVTKVTWRVPLHVLDKDLLSLPEHLSSLRFLVGFVLRNLLSSLYCIVDRCLSISSFLWTFILIFLWFTASDYHFGILDLRLLITTLVSLIYGFWLPLWYLRIMASDYPFGILDLRFLITPLVS